MDSSKLLEYVWKGFTLLLYVIVIPLAGWVWSTNIKVNDLQNDLGDLEREVAELKVDVKEAENNGKAIIRIESDIEHMKGSLIRIEDLVR